MDLLEQYNKQYPEASREPKPSPLMDEYGRTYTGMIAVVMRLSGGRIKNVQQAIYVLLAAVLIIAGAAIVVFFRTAVPSAPTKIYSPIAEPQL